MSDITLKDLREEWKNDCVINKEKANDEILRIPALHSKYMCYMSECKIMYSETLFNLKKLCGDKREYYSGLTSKEKLEKMGWKPFKLRLAKTDIQPYIDADDDVIQLKKRLTYYEEMKDFCESIIKELQNRTWQIREYLTHERYLNGSR